MSILNLYKNKIALVGLGYVGLPLAVAFAEQYKVVGYDVDINRINELKNSTDRTLELDSSLLDSVKNNLSYSSDINDIEDCNIYIVTVPTPIDENNHPDLTPLIESSKNVGSVLRKGDIVIYESTVYPGATEDVCVPILESKSSLCYNRDFYCGYSPERINLGDKEHTVKNILKVTSGSTPEIGRFINELYKSIITAGTHLAPSIKVAEASKVIENTQRDLNIALINELAMIFNKLDINTYDVIEAAGTKWNFIKLYPGLVGGHCIGVDPYYLTYKAQEVGYEPHLILNARAINNGMSKYIVDATVKEMISKDVVVKNSNVLVLGVTFKENCSDMRNSKVIDVITGLKDFGINVDVYDPWIDISLEKNWYTHGIISDPILNDKKYDAILVTVAHDQFKAYSTLDYDKISVDNKIIIDVKNIVKDPTWSL